jgi:hypothetical protein
MVTRIKIVYFQDVTPYSLENGCLYFTETCFLHIQCKCESSLDVGMLVEKGGNGGKLLFHF